MKRKLKAKMHEELQNKQLFEKAKSFAYDYIDGIEKMNVFPDETALKGLDNFDESLPNETGNALHVLEQLNEFGSPGTIAQTGGRYFGFVDGGAVPVSLGVKWLSDVWDQCGGLYMTSPINSKLESVCEQWLVDLFNLPKQTVAGFVSGTSMANLCALAAARYQLLKNMGWDVNEQGLNAAPKIRIIAHKQVHASIKKTLALLGFGLQSIEWIPSDDQGRLLKAGLPELDKTCLVLAQAGNANTGAFDDLEFVCKRANKVGAWVHVDGAFGLWAAASQKLANLTKGIELADSWAVDGHKTLNTPYDSGIVLCRHPKSIRTALAANGEYIIYSDKKDPLMTTPEMSKRSRAIELWATMKYLGKEGIDEMVYTFHARAKQMAEGLQKIGYTLLNDVVFNQVLISTDNEARTKSIIDFVQKSGKLWVGGSTWNGKAVIRISICSWMTDENDINESLKVFESAFTSKTSN